MREIAWIITLVTLASVIIGCSKPPEKAAVPTVINTVIHHERSLLPVWHPDYKTAESVVYTTAEPSANELEGVQCPIPFNNRVMNYTGIQCVFSSLECLGRWADLKALIDPPLTSRSDCKSYSGPADASAKLTRLGVKFEMSYRDRTKSVALVKKAMKDGRGCLFGVPGHAMVLCHYDEDKQIVKYINNSAYKVMPIQQMTMKKFNQIWDNWVIVVYAEPDLFPDKVKPYLPNLIPIVDHNGPQGKYKNYIPKPQK